MYVGNTRFIQPANGGTRDHPHVCGEYFLSIFTVVKRSGSPPCMWGIPIFHVFHHDKGRITPMYVGNTRQSCFTTIYKKDHPHVCGEYCFLIFGKVLKWGSPPCMWGILSLPVSCAWRHGITPMYVGNTRQSGIESTTMQDHPHVCGEY